MVKRYFYSDSLNIFHNKSETEILGELTHANSFSLEVNQRTAWETEIKTVKELLKTNNHDGYVFFEYSIPRMGRRIDCVLIIEHVLFVIEFKVNETHYPISAIDQVWDYALELKNFHEPSHQLVIAPILVSTHARDIINKATLTVRDDKLLDPICSNISSLPKTIKKILTETNGLPINATSWAEGRYRPTPTIVDAATALYGGHSVEDIARSDADTTNLSQTCTSISNLVSWARTNSKKAICFVTGVPGAGKTLVGLNIAAKHNKREDGVYSVYLSGNGPLVKILHEALARDQVRRSCALGSPLKKSTTLSEVKMFIQNIHHFRDECLRDMESPPIEHVAIFDEAQRAWDKSQTIKFMATKKGIKEFSSSEPEFLISCLDRHPDWAVIICLVGGGQEINTGESGISEWINAIIKLFPSWHIFMSSQLNDSEYQLEKVSSQLTSFPNKEFNSDLHLKVSIRSFRAETVSGLVKSLLESDARAAKQLYSQVADKYPIFITRHLEEAKKWLRSKARGTERYGLLASSKAQRLRPHAVDVRIEINPIHWFLNSKADVRSSYFLEDAATEFDVQGLELDWACVLWDGDFRKTADGWGHWSFRGEDWAKIAKKEIQKYQLNAYRVLLTRARQGMVIFIPEGSVHDHTRKPEYYDPTFDYLAELGFPVI